MIRTLLVTSLVVFAAGTAQAETVKVADARMDTTAESDGFVLFISRRYADDSPAGDAIVAVGKGEAPDGIQIEAAFGMYYEKGQAKSGKVSVEIIDSLRASTEGQPVLTFIARVNTDTYDTAVEKLKAWEKGEDVTPSSPNGQVLETARIMILDIEELKMPYTSGFTPNTQMFFEDLHILNRKK